ncbi:MAG TPA: hypothetical protein VMX55_09630 [candidate division Zixibacteria bacterium]|nr:hypothetical protein [candidate division Zixibacteria bacterium]
MNSEGTDNTKMLRLVALISAAIFNFVGMILVFTTDFSGWWAGGSGNYYYWIGSEMAPVWLQLFLVLLGLIFLFSLAYSIVLIIVVLGKINLPINFKIQGIVGIIIAGIIFLFTILILIIFAIFASDAYEWWLATSFYSSIVGSIILAIFYIFYLLLASREETGVPAK